MAKTKFDTLLIVDLEFTCWESPLAKPPGETSEIMEIGLCIFDTQSWQPVDKGQIIVKPIQSTVSKYCSQLTGWTQNNLDTLGISFSAACTRLTSEYNTKKYPWASWGAFDRLAFERECRHKDVKYPFTASHLDLKTLFAIHFGLTRGISLCDALQMLKLPVQGRLHSGIYDAWNASKILEKQGRF